MSEGFLFDPIEYTDERLRAAMLGNTCRTCAHRATVRQGYEGLSAVCVCDARKSRRTKSGQLRVRVDQPACIMYEKNKL